MQQFSSFAFTCFANLALVYTAASLATKTSLSPDLIKEIADRLHYTISNQPPTPGADRLTVVNLDLLPDDVIADDVEAGVQDEFDNVDKELGDAPENLTLPEHHINREMSLMYQGVYVPDARFNPFVDGILVNMVAEMRRRQMDPLYFRVLKGGGVEYVPTRRKEDKPTEADAGPGQAPEKLQSERLKDEKPKREPIGGGVIRGLTRIKRFGNAEVQTSGNATLVRSHCIFGPLTVEFVFDTTTGVQIINTTLTALAGHGLARVNSTDAQFLDFIIDSPATYEIKLRGSEQNQRLRRLSRTAILRLVRREGRLERRLMRMFERGGRKPLPKEADAEINGNLWPNVVRNMNKTSSPEDEVPPKKEMKLISKKDKFLLSPKKVVKQKIFDNIPD
ncbi:uncharacterized protein LOC108680738 [Hyalella azteca]|uniref:Uncharacterized protein LOC108680738 n=1 Tax=Hyalella azteca TaxID=294128 RepID=A0A8B7PG44_HYAAZ|nr:uncharacterized protein LOC108680738 [Hyalella azteca]